MINKRLITTIACLHIALLSLAQFHTMKIPQTSNHVTETQTLAITDISIDYHSPATRGRDVWNNTGIIPQNGDPIAWRAGANMNTTISFSTDVVINGKSLEKGTYGFHIIPHENTFELIFAHNAKQWGSYYLDLENDVTLTVEVEAEDCPHSEKLDFEFLNWKEDEVTIALEWASKRLPFKVSVDLNETVLSSFRDELRGINTYHWQAWNDAAQWCLNHDTNLEEALAWAKRSINGGYNGFSANKNVTNLTTKAQLENKLGLNSELDNTINEISQMELNPNETNAFSIFLLRIEKWDPAMKLLNSSVKKYPDVWFLYLNRALTYYFMSDNKKALRELNKVKEMAPDFFKERLDVISSEVENNTYKIPGT